MRILSILVLLAFSAGAAFGFCPTKHNQSAQLCGNEEFDSCSISVTSFDTAGTAYPVERFYCIHIPSAPQEDLPVVFGFHGGGQEPSDQVAVWDKHTEQGMVLVAPAALMSEDGPKCKPKWRHLGREAATWSDLETIDTCLTEQVPPSPPVAAPKVADLDFVRDLMQGIESDLDVSNMYASGFSSGAGLVYQLFITRPFVDNLAGFAAVSNTMTPQKRDAAAGTGGLNGVAGYTRNVDTRRPFLFFMGTADKINSAVLSILETAPTCDYDTDCVAGTDCSAVVQEGIDCWLSAVVAGRTAHKMSTPRAENIAWLTHHNGSHPNPVLGLYPNVGSHGAVPTGAKVDATAVIRQDYLAVAPGAAPVTAVTILGGGHVTPGRDGDYPPCANCDVDATEVTLQFWRAHAGFRSEWP